MKRTRRIFTEISIWMGLSFFLATQFLWYDPTSVTILGVMGASSFATGAIILSGWSP